MLWRCVSGAAWSGGLSLLSPNTRQLVKLTRRYPFSTALWRYMRVTLIPSNLSPKREGGQAYQLRSCMSFFLSVFIFCHSRRQYSTLQSCWSLRRDHRLHCVDEFILRTGTTDCIGSTSSFRGQRQQQQHEQHFAQNNLGAMCSFCILFSVHAVKTRGDWLALFLKTSVIIVGRGLEPTEAYMKRGMKSIFCSKFLWPTWLLKPIS